MNRSSRVPQVFLSTVLAVIAVQPTFAAEGTDFWSLFVDMAALDDGPHTISVKAIDINRTEGPVVSIPIELDTTKPVSLTESHESGLVISKKTTIQGMVEDSNGASGLWRGHRRRPIWVRRTTS